MASNENYVIRVRRGTTNEWAVYNPILGAGELGFDTTATRLKVGDGLNVWSNLDFATGNSFDVARDAGFVGTLSEWLESIKGKDGVGPANVLTVGTVSTGPEPAVTISGDSPSQVIDFTFPTAGEPIEYGKATPTKDGLMPKEDKAVLDDASQFGKEFLTNTDAAAARTNLLLSAGALSPTGISSELSSGNQTNSRVWSPKTIADYVKSGDSAVLSSANNYTDIAVDKVSEDVDNLDTPKPNLGYREIKHCIAFRSYPGVTNEWVQGFNVDEEENCYYLGLQNSSNYRIIKISREDLSYIDSKSFAMPEGAFAESLPFWRNSENKLCFLMRTGVGATEGSYNVYNYDDGVMGPQVPINGIWRFGQVDNVLITSDARTNNVGIFYVYDWESVKVGAPVLKTKIYPNNIRSSTQKNQGLQGMSNSIVVQQAAIYEPHTLMEYNYMGNLINTYSWALPEVADEINNKFPGTIPDRNSFKSEGEGLARLNDNTLVSLWTVNEGSAARAIIIEHGTKNSKYTNNKKIDIAGTVEYDTNFGGSSTAKLIKEGRKVTIFLDGVITIEARTNKALFKVPDEFVPVTSQRIFLNCAATDTSEVTQSALYVGTSKWLTAENKSNIPITTISRSVSTYDLYI